MPSSEPSTERMAKCRDAWKLHHEQGMSFADIAYGWELVFENGQPRRGMIQRMVDTYDHWRVVNELRQQNAMLQTRVIELESKQDDLFGHDLGKPWELEGDWIVCGDVHLNTTRGDFMQKPLLIADKMLTGSKRLLISGDFLNADAWSDYPQIYPLPSFSKELRAARYFLDMYLEVFDEIWITQGNHDRRVQKNSKNAISSEDLMRMITHDERVKVSHWGHAVIKTPTGEWRATHGSEFSVQTLSVADQMAQKYKQHIISHHQHHCSIGWDRFKQFVIIDNGGLFDEASLAYVLLDDNKRPRMANGFTCLVNGTPYLFGSAPFTDWSYWLGEQAERKTA